MSIVEDPRQKVPVFEITRLKVRNDQSIQLTVDLNKEDPMLVNPAPRDLRAELEGMLSCESWNERREAAIVEGRYNFKTGEIISRPSRENLVGEVEQDSRSMRGVFVRRATQVVIDGKPRSRLTMLPEKHADNYPVVVGNNGHTSKKVRLERGRFRIWESLPDGSIRPIVPSSILKAPEITPEDVDLADMEKTEIGTNTLPKFHTNGVLPDTRFIVQEIAVFTTQRK